MTPLVLGVAGLGLIGGSIALRARAGGATVIGYDRDAGALAAAAGVLTGTAATLAELAARSDVLVLALPVEATVAALAGTPELARPRLVFDVASVKGPVAAAGAHLPNFVPSHPLAGREIAGFAGADAGLFAGRVWVLVPGGSPAARAELAGLIAAFDARVLELDAAAHDRLLAATSHLPQVLSVVLAERLGAVAAGDPRAFAVCGTGIGSMLRLAHSPAEIWTSIARSNAAPVAAELRALAGRLETLAAEIARGETAALDAAFGAARRTLAALESPSPPLRSEAVTRHRHEVS